MENIVVVKFKIESEAYQAFSELKKKISNDCIISQLVIVKREDNKYEIKDSYDSGVNTQDDRVIGGLIGGLIGLVGGPLGVLVHGSIGALIGATIDAGDQSSEYSKIEHISQTLDEGETALIGLVQENNEKFIDIKIEKKKKKKKKFKAAEVAQKIK